WLNVAMIASLGGAGLHYASTPLGEVHWLCAGVLVGGFFQMSVPAVVLVRLGWRPHFTLQLPPGVRQVARLMLPGLLGTAIYQINIFVSRILAFSLPISAATMMFYANRLMELPIGVFAIAIATVVYPLLARHAAQGDMKAMSRDFHRGLRLILAINVPAAVGLGLLSEPIVRLLYQRGQFTADNTALMAPLLSLFVIGMPLFSISSLTVRAFYSIKDTKTPVRVALIDFVLNLVLSLVLKRVLGAYGLVLASTTAILVQTILLQVALTRRLPGLAFGSHWGTVMKIVVATALMAGLVWFGWHELQGFGLGRRADLIAVVGLIPLGVAVYGVALWMLRIEGREELWALVMRRPLKPNA
ncbi:MAG TPA: murein biosynthesis integral membrane protein MurJ, partial [Candidatus Didemnitutus sp.]